MNNHFTRTHAALDRHPLQTQFAVNGTCEVTEVHPGIAHLIALSRDNFSPEVRRRLEKAEWEEQLVTRKFAPPQPDFAAITEVHWDWANVPPHKRAEVEEIMETLRVRELQAFDASTKFTQTQAMGKSEAPTPPNEARSLARKFAGRPLPTEPFPAYSLSPVAVQVEQGYHGPNGFVKIEPDTPLHVHTARLHLKDGKVIELHDATLTLQPKWISQ